MLIQKRRETLERMAAYAPARRGSWSSCLKCVGTGDYSRRAAKSILLA